MIEVHATAFTQNIADSLRGGWHTLQQIREQNHIHRLGKHRARDARAVVIEQGRRYENLR